MKDRTMTPTPKMLYVLADGARARFVERQRETRSFATVEEIDARHRLRSLREKLREGAVALSFQSGDSGNRHTVVADDAVQRAKSDFVREVADRAAELLRKRGFQKVVVAAPDRLLPRLRERLEDAGAQTIAINRDLTKTPDDALGPWLEGAALR